MSNYEEMNKVLNEQKDYFIKNGPPSIDLRIDRLERLKTLKILSDSNSNKIILTTINSIIQKTIPNYLINEN